MTAGNVSLRIVGGHRPPLQWLTRLGGGQPWQRESVTQDLAGATSDPDSVLRFSRYER